MNTTLDLWNPIVPVEAQHDNFKRLLLKNDISQLNEIKNWTNGFVDRDGKIIKEFQTSFNSSLWEFYLNRSLHELGINIDYNYERPDFVLGSRKIIIEACIASNSDGRPRESERDYRDLNKFTGDITKFTRDATLRLSNALIAKYRKHQNEYSKIPIIGQHAFGIAVHPFDNPFFWIENESPPLMLLYGFVRDLGVEKRDGVYQSTGFEKVGELTKENGTSVEMGWFLDDDFSDVSFILYSTLATTTKAKVVLNNELDQFGLIDVLKYNMNGAEPIHEEVELNKYKESILEGIKIYHNPFAKRPVDPAVFESPFICQYFYDIERDRIMKYNYRDGMVIQRQYINDKRMFMSNNSMHGSRLRQPGDL